jgi:hypothetical protein
MKIDLAFDNTRLEDIAVFICDFSGLNIVIDPTLDMGIVETFRVKGETLRSTVDILCAVKELDYDFRYGVLFFSKPLRIWSTDPKIGLPAANRWALQPDNSPTADKLRRIRVTVDMQNSPMSAICDYLREIAGLAFRPELPLDIEPITLKVQDLPLTHLLELLTLPYGRDARIEEQGVVIFKTR